MPNMNPAGITRRVRAAGCPRATSNVYKPGVVLVFLGDGTTERQAHEAWTALSLAGYHATRRGILNVFVTSPGAGL